MRKGGLYLERGGIWYIDKIIDGMRIRGSTFTTDRAVAELKLEEICQRHIQAKASAEWAATCEAMLAEKNSWLNKTHRSILYRTRKRKRAACLTLQELKWLLERTDGKCRLTGIPFSWERPPGSNKAPPFIMSVDRIDSTKDYQVWNCRIVCLAVNLAMRDWGEAVLARIGKAMLLKELNEGIGAPYVGSVPVNGPRQEKGSSAATDNPLIYC